MKFERYQHLVKIGDSTLRGLLEGTVYVFPKIDGANSSFYMGEDGEFKFASRNMEISEDKEGLKGFREYIKANEVKLRAFFKEFPDLRLYGEFLIPHSLRTYRDEAWNKFYCFDVMTELGNYMSYDEYKPILEEFDIEYIPPLVILKYPNEEDLSIWLDKNTYLVKDGQGFGEGCVFKNYYYTNQFGRVVWGKLVRNDFKEKHVKAMGANVFEEKAQVEEAIIKSVTEALILKEKAKIEQEEGWSSKHIPRLLGVVWHCLLTEELADNIKKMKNPTVDFKKLNRLCIEKTKKVAGI